MNTYEHKNDVKISKGLEIGENYADHQQKRQTC